MTHKSIFALTLTGHLVLLLLFGISISNHKINLGESYTIVSYAYQVNSQPQSENINKVSRSEKQTIHTSKSKHIKQSNKRFAQPQVKEGNGKPISELIALLHAAIQTQQHYPDGALQMERTGRTTLGFLLFPNGTIQQLRILKTSGTEALDEAAIAAVNSAVPFKGVDKYLTQAQEYQISVAFELA